MNPLRQGRKNTTPTKSIRPFNARPPTMATESSNKDCGDCPSKEGTPRKEATAADVVSLFSRMCIINTRKMERFHQQKAEKVAIAAREKKEADDEKERIREAEIQRIREQDRIEQIKQEEKRLWRIKMMEREERAARRVRERALMTQNADSQLLESNPWTKWTTPPLGS